MFSTQMQAIYQRLLVLGLLLMGLFFFGLSDEVQNVRAKAPCMQECESAQFSCNDDCRNSCLSDKTSAECDSCVLSCRSAFHSCMRHAVWCDNEVSNPGNCEVGFGRHCVITGPNTTDCSTSGGAYDAYYLTCTNIGGGSCVSCPGQRFCWGTDGTQPCV